MLFINHLITLEVLNLTESPQSNIVITGNKSLSFICSGKVTTDIIEKDSHPSFPLYYLYQANIFLIRSTFRRTLSPVKALPSNIC